MHAYQTVRDDSRIELIIQKSRFIGWCSPIDCEDAALRKLEEIRKQHREASHNCYAYAIGASGGAARFSDDGEPSGTAGQPMMEVIRLKGVTDLICVVTRYFGGVLLGTGGLVRAYSKAASAAIDAAGPIWMRPCREYTLNIGYERWSTLEALLRAHAKIAQVEYAETVHTCVLVPQEQCPAFEAMVIDRTDGQIQPQAMNMRFIAYEPR